MILGTFEKVFGDAPKLNLRVQKGSYFNLMSMNRLITSEKTRLKA